MSADLFAVVSPARPAAGPEAAVSRRSAAAANAENAARQCQTLDAGQATPALSRTGQAPSRADLPEGQARASFAAGPKAVT